MFHVEHLNKIMDNETSKKDRIIKFEQIISDKIISNIDANFSFEYVSNMLNLYANEKLDKSKLVGLERLRANILFCAIKNIIDSKGDDIFKANNLFALHFLYFEIYNELQRIRFTYFFNKNEQQNKQKNNEKNTNH
jgi:hypothetical protein